MANLHILLLEVVLAVAAIMLLDYLRKGWRGWAYYGLAFLMILAFFIAEIVVSMLVLRGKW